MTLEERVKVLEKVVIAEPKGLEQRVRILEAEVLAIKERLNRVSEQVAVQMVQADLEEKVKWLTRRVERKAKKNESSSQ